MRVVCAKCGKTTRMIRSTCERRKRMRWCYPCYRRWRRVWWEQKRKPCKRMLTHDPRALAELGGTDET